MTGWVKFLKPWLGCTWVVTAIVIAIAGFSNPGPFMNFFNRRFQVTENWRGGKINSVKFHEGYRTIVHQPVFEGLLTETGRGFVRIDWASENECRLPDVIVETFDYNNDGKIDFKIRLNTFKNTVVFHSYCGPDLTLSDEKVLVFDKSRSLRINIHKRR